MERQLRIGALVPCYNGESTIGEVIRGILTQLPEVIVVDDGSGDGTYKKAKDAGAYVLSHKENKGKGAALKTGFEYIKKNTDWDAVIIMDADGQHDWSEIPKFIDAAQRENKEIILGNRMDSAINMPWLRWWTNKITSRLVSWIVRQKIPDSQCGFRLIRTRVLKDLVLTTSRFDTESEILIKAASLGHSISSVPVKSIYRDESSYIHPVRDTIKFIKLVKSYHGRARRDKK